MAGTLDLATLLVRLKGDASSYRTEVSGARKQTQDLSADLKDKLSKAATAGFAAATAAVAAFAVDSTREFLQFESQMGEVFSILPGISKTAMSAMQDDVLAFSTEVGRTSDETIPALYQALSSGVPQSNVFDFMKIASDAALGGVTELETAVDGITSVVNAYGLEMISAQEASDLMFTATVGGKTTFDELSRSLYNVIPTAASLKLEFSNITAALATMTAAGTPTAVATTQLRQLLVELSQAGGKASTTFKEMAGVTFVEFIAQGGNLQQALQLMEQAAADGNVRLSDLFSSVEAGNAALSLTGESTAKFSAELDAAANSAGATADAAAIMSDTGQQAVNELKAAFEALKITVGEGLAPTVREFAEEATERLGLMSSTSRLNEMAGDLRDMGLTMGQVNDIIGDGKAQFDLWRTSADMEDDLARNEEGMRRMAYAAEALNLGLSATSEVQGTVANGFAEGTSEVEAYVAEQERLFQINQQNAQYDEILTRGTYDVREATIAATEATDGWMAAQTAAAGATLEYSETLSTYEQQLALLESGEREMTFSTQAAITAGQLAADARLAEAEATRLAAEAVTEYEQFLSGSFVDALTNSSGQEMNWRNELFTTAAQYGLNATQLGLLAAATGEYTEEEIQAALEAAAMKQKVEELAQAIANNEMTVANALVELDTFKANLTATGTEASTAQEKVDQYVDTLESIPETVSTTVTADTGAAEAAVARLYDKLRELGDGDIGVGGPGGGGNIPENAMGTNYFQGGTTWVGEEGPELVSLPRGSQIFSTDESMSLAGARYEIHVDARGSNLTERQITQAVEIALKRAGVEADAIRRVGG